MVLYDGNGLPFAVDVDSANCAEVNLIERLLDSAFTDYVPNKLIYNKAADSDKLRDRLADRHVELVCPHRRGRVRPSRHHRRVLRRYQRRWKIEQTTCWLQDFRRLVTRYEFCSFLFHRFCQARKPNDAVQTVLKLSVLRFSSQPFYTNSFAEQNESCVPAETQYVGQEPPPAHSQDS